MLLFPAIIERRWRGVITTRQAAHGHALKALLFVASSKFESLGTSYASDWRADAPLMFPFCSQGKHM
jgi:hypothetical protein